MKKESWMKILWVTIFAIAMGFLETVVVVYLRKIYYPDGFNFPLPNIEPGVISIELVREFFTIVMLVSIGYLAAKKFYLRLAYFLYAFAIWDIFYYIFLKIILNWPVSFFTWDILFFIPWPWIGPVLAPVICSLTMMVLAFFIINYDEKKVKINLNEWILLIIGSLLILFTFLYDYAKLITQGKFWSDFLNLATNFDFQQIMGNYVPGNYNWILFLIGEVLLIAAIVLFYFRNKK